MSTSKKAFKGGYRFKNFQGKPLPIIVNMDAPARVTIPMQQGFGSPAEPTVAVGDPVRAGEIIGANADGTGSPVHTSVTGVVSELTGRGKNTIPAAVIEKDPSFVYTPDAIQKLAGCSEDWRSLDTEKISELIYFSGAASLDSCGIPLAGQGSKVRAAEIEHVIVKVVEDDLLCPSPAVLLEQSGVSTLIDGCRMLKRVLPNALVHIAVSKNLKDLANAIEEACTDSDGFDIGIVSDKYPQGFDEVLVPTILGGEYAHGFTSANMGVTVVDVQTILHIVEAVTTGMPVISRVVAMGGSGFLENVYLRMPVGTPRSVIVDKYAKNDGEYRVICNSLIHGPTISDINLPVTRTCSAVYAIPEVRSTELMPFATPGFTKDSYSNTFPTFLLPLAKRLDTNIHGEERACLSCSFCMDVCPVGIMPNLIHRYVERDIIDESIQSFGIFKCIDCNLCTYVCPSKIPVASLLKQGKDRLRAEGLNDDNKTKESFTLKGIE